MTPRSTFQLALVLTVLLAAASGCLFDSDPPNKPPVIGDITATPGRVSPDSAATVTAQAHDPEGVPLDYAWKATAGWFESGSYEATASWRAPSTSGPCTLTVTVGDGRDEVVGDLVVTVTEHVDTPHMVFDIIGSGFWVEETRLPVFILSDGGIPAAWTASFDAEWAAPDPSAGVLAPGEADTIWVEADRSTTAAGMKTGNLTIRTGEDDIVLPFTMIQPWTYDVIARYPHDTDAFTQGLAWHDGSLYEGTGHYGHSLLREVELTTGDIVREVSLNGSDFGEGITVWQDRIIQLTWQQGTAYVWALADFAPLGTFDYSTAGWGLTHDGARLIMSDGTSTLYFRDPATFAEIGRVTVTHFGFPRDALNELEWIDGTVWANIWQTDYIAKIAPESGEVVDVVDLTGLLDSSRRTMPNVLNGIAHDPTTGRIWVTGKYWPWLFEIEPVDPGTR